MSNYFSYLPEVYVRTSSYRKDNKDPYVLAKNIFRRIKIRENLDDAILGFTQYTIPNNSRPDQVALEKYGDMSYDWVILLVNNIINVYDEWPMTEHELYQFMVRKYGEEEVNSVHHYVTQTVKDNYGRVVLKPDIQVPENFTYKKYDGTYVPKEELIRPISNYDYEAENNEYKRNIYLLRKDYLAQFVDEFQQLVEYLPSVETDPESNSKKSSNTIVEAFVNVKPTYQSLVGQTSSIEFASQQEFTSRTFSTSGATISEGDVLADGSTVVTTGVAGTTSVAGEVSNTVTNQYGASTGGATY